MVVGRIKLLEFQNNQGDSRKKRVLYQLNHAQLPVRRSTQSNSDLSALHVSGQHNRLKRRSIQVMCRIERWEAEGVEGRSALSMRSNAIHSHIKNDKNDMFSVI